MAPFDRFRAIPGSVDIYIAQRIHLRRQTLTSYENLRSPEISVLSIATRQLRQGGTFDRNGEKEIERNRAGCRCRPFPRTAHSEKQWEIGLQRSPHDFVYHLGKQVLRHYYLVCSKQALLHHYLLTLLHTNYTHCTHCIHAVSALQVEGLVSESAEKGHDDCLDEDKPLLSLAVAACWVLAGCLLAACWLLAGCLLAACWLRAGCFIVYARVVK